MKLSDIDKVLAESVSVGGTGAGAIAAVPMPSGEIRKRPSPFGKKKEKKQKKIDYGVPKQKMNIDETIRKVGSKYRLYSKKGKNLGTYDSRAGAEKRERQVQYFKHNESEEKLPGVKTLSPEEIAQHHGVNLEQIMQQLEMGIKVEYEHTKDRATAREIALDHLLEMPDYYTRLADMEGDVEESFKTDTTGLPTPDDIIWKDPDYFKRRKGVEGEVVYMSPEQYIQKCKEGFASIGEIGNIRAGRYDEKIDKYAEMMKQGVEFDMPMLDYRDEFSQEGLHRAFAAQKLGINEMPVAVLRKTKEAQEKERAEQDRRRQEMLNKYKDDEPEQEPDSSSEEDDNGEIDPDVQRILDMFGL